MIDWEHVASRIHSGEDEITEFKSWSGSLEGAAKAICAFSNTCGGLLVLGVSDRGELVEVDEEALAMQERLSSLLQSGLSSPVSASLGMDPTTRVHWVAVRRYRGPEPMRFRGRVYVRRGRASVEPSSAELQDLFNGFGFVLTEEQVVAGSSLEDIDVEAFRSFLQRQGFDIEQEPQPAVTTDLCNRGVLVEVEQELCASVYGVLCFGRNPQRFVPLQNAWLELVAYAGSSRADEVLLRGEAKGRLDEQVARALGWARTLGTREIYEGDRRRDQPVLPPRALREAIVNALAHRDYAILGAKVLVEVFADRVDITSPGELPNHMSEAAVLAGAHPRSRNQLLAHFLFVQGYMESRGRGLPIIRKEMQSFNQTEPLLHNNRDGRFVRLTLLL